MRLMLADLTAGTLFIEMEWLPSSRIHGVRGPFKVLGSEELKAESQNPVRFIDALYIKDPKVAPTNPSRHMNEIYITVVEVKGGVPASKREQFKMRVPRNSVPVDVHTELGPRLPAGDYSAFFSADDAPQLEAIKTFDEYLKFAGISR